MRIQKATIPHILRPQDLPLATLPSVQGVYILCVRNLDGTKAHLSHCGHYIGCSDHIYHRYRHHLACRGDNVTSAIMKAGLTLWLTGIWEGEGYAFEQLLKSEKKSQNYCPYCRTEGTGAGVQDRWEMKI